MQIGVERLISEESLRSQLKNSRIAFLGHPASMVLLHGELRHSIDALMTCRDLKLTCAMGPQHGMRGDKQDNMIESYDYVDPIHKFPVFSLYGKVRRPTDEMLSHFDTLLVDLQDVGCRIYTFLTTLLYMLEACAKQGKSVWVLDRPNPAGRPVEGQILKPGWESFVGAGPLPMRHGLTLGEAAQWFTEHFKLDVDLTVIKMKDYDPESAPGYGWPLGQLPWVNPSPNAASLSMTRCYPGTVMVEGTQLSEGRGTTKPLEMMGAPHLDMRGLLELMKKMAPHWMEGCQLRICYFEPTFHKHAGKLCTGFQIHVDDHTYEHQRFKPYRLIALWFKAIRKLHPEFEIWRSFAYEYETERLAIDLINGSHDLRTWVDDPKSTPEDLDRLLIPDENAWIENRKKHLLYGV